MRRIGRMTVGAPRGRFAEGGEALQYVLGVDIGSSGMKLSFLGQDGSMLGPYGVELKTGFPAPGWAEQDPDDWYRALCSLLPRSLREAGLHGGDITAVAVDAATHTTVLLDADMRPVRDAIMWNDQRSAAVAEECAAAWGDEIYRRTYHAPSAMWSLCQMLWVRRQEPERWRRVRKLLFAKDYLRWRMGGRYVTDVIDAQGSMLLDMATMAWDPFLCGLAGLEPAWLPEILQPCDPAGAVSARCAEETGLPAGIPLYAGSSDTVMELLAVGAIHRGDATIKLATSGRICLITDRAWPDPLLVNYRHVVPGLWYPGTGTRSCATSLRWFKDCFCGADARAAAAAGESIYDVLDREAASVPAGAEGLLFHPYLLGEFTPYQDPNLRGSFTGISMKHTRAHFVRALMEGCAFSLLDCRGALERMGLAMPERFSIIGGGAAGTVWRQIVADGFQCVLSRPAYSDSSRGSAILAAVACGMFRDFEEAVSVCENPATEVLPRPAYGAFYRELFALYREVHDRLAELYPRLTALRPPAEAPTLHN